MKIKTKSLAALFTCVSILIILYALYFYMYYKKDVLKAENARMDNIIVNINRLNLLIQDYRLSRSRRAENQWNAIYMITDNALKEEISLIESSDTAEAKLFLNDKIFILNELHRLGEIFKNYTTTGLKDSQYHVLTYQGTVKVHRIISVSSYVTGKINSRLEYFQKLLDITTAVIMVLFSFFIVYGFYGIILPVLNSLKDVSDYAESIGRGSFDKRIIIKKQDEIGDLALAFNRMADNLNVITASRDELNIEITRRRETEIKLQEVIRELDRSNTELQQFAYVASHDLQEPLRMISSFLQLIEQRYSDKLDSDGREFINYAVDGASRMQTLILGLLEFSRISSRGQPFTEVDIKDIIDSVITDLGLLISEKGGEVTCSSLPVITGDGEQIYRLFLNIIQNALKFVPEGVRPVINIKGEKVKDEYVFSVKDNGIGIESRYFERIFIIFRRLHSREEYGGTGMGLAICKRIVERHGGRIWVDSEPGSGSTFYFSIPFYHRDENDPVN